MRRSRIGNTMIAAAFVGTLSGPGTFVAAQTTSGAKEGQAPAQAPAASSGADASANRPSGDYGPGGVPRTGQATTQPSVPPNTAGASEQTRSSG